MSSSSQKVPVATSDTIIRAAPFAQAVHPLLGGRAKPLPEKPKTKAMLFDEDRCDVCTDILIDSRSPLQQKLKAASELSGLMAKIGDSDALHNAIYLLRETMLEDSEHPLLRAECARALALCGRLDTIIELAKVIRKGVDSVSSQVIAVRALSLQRGDYALDALMDVVEFGGHPDVRFAAAMELASTGIDRARQAAEHFVKTARFSEEAIRVKEALSCSTVN